MCAVCCMTAEITKTAAVPIEKERKKSPKIAVEENANNGMERRNDDDQTIAKKKSEQNIESTHLWRFIFIPFFFLFIFSMWHTHASLCVCFTHNFLLFDFFLLYPFYAHSFLSLSIEALLRYLKWNRRSERKSPTKRNVSKIRQLVSCTQQQSNFNSVIIVDASWYCCVLAIVFSLRFFYCIALKNKHFIASNRVQFSILSAKFWLYERKYICFLIASTTLSLECRFIIGNQQNQFCIFLSLISIIVVRAT